MKDTGRKERSRGAARLLLVAFLALVAGLLLLLALGGRDWRRGEAPVGSTTNTTADTRELEPPTSPATSSVPERSAATVAHTLTTDLVRVRGRCVDEHGNPLSGVAISSLDNAKVPTSVTISGEDGRFETSWSATSSGRGTIVAAFTGLEERHVRRTDLAAGADLDLGDLRLLPLASWSGRFVDPAGDPRLGEHWRIALHSRGRATTTASSDPATGRFHFEGLPPGRYHARAERDGNHMTDVVRFELTNGQRLVQDIVYVGPRHPDRITVMGLGVRPPRPECVRLLPEGGGEPLLGSRAKVVEVGCVWFENLEPGSYTVVVDDPGLETFEREGVRPGDHISYQVAGLSALEIAVRCADGSYEHFFSARARILSSRTYRSFPATSMTDPFAPGAQKIEGLSGGLIELTVDRNEGARRIVELELPERGSVRHVVQLPPSGTITGRVVDDQGKPCDDVEVRLLRRAVRDDGPFSEATSLVSHERYDQQVPDSRRGTLGIARAGADGRFELLDVRPGSWVVRPQRRIGPGGDHPIEITGTETVDLGDLRLARPGTIAVRCVGVDESVALDGLRLLVDRPEATPTLAWLARPPGSRLRAKVDSAGRAEVEVPSGHWSLAVLGASTHARLLDLGTVELEPGARLELDADLTERTGTLRVSHGGGLGTAQTSGYVKLDAHGPTEANLPLARTPDEREIALPPGSYDLALSNSLGYWSRPVGDSIVVEAGATTDVRVDLGLVPGELLFVRAVGGAGLQREWLEWGHDTPDGSISWTPFGTGKGGPQPFLLPLGTYYVRQPATSTLPAGPLVEIPWAESGPAENVVRVPAR